MADPEASHPPHRSEARTAPLGQQLDALLDFITAAVSGIDPEHTDEGEEVSMRELTLPDTSTVECIHTIITDPNVLNTREIRRVAPTRIDYVTFHDGERYSYHQIAGTTMHTAARLAIDAAAADEHFTDSVAEIASAIAQPVPGSA